MMITTTKRIGALALMAAFALGACSSGSGGSAAPSAAAPSEGAPSVAPESSAPAVSGTVTIDGSSTVYPDHRGRRRGVPEGEQRRPGHRSRSPAPAAASRSSASARPTSTTPRARSRPTTRARARPARPTASSSSSSQVAIDGLSVVVNPANTFATCLTVDELEEDLGTRTSTEDLTWKDVRADFPAEAVNLFMPGADSGHLRLLHRGDQRRGRRGHADYAPSPRTTTPW